MTQLGVNFEQQPVESQTKDKCRKSEQYQKRNREFAQQLS